ncbi:hypothetical protein K503DRAFT_171544 [Rhizopogon vinicolor AM-OR11-026]|uniref:Uncharacterized protein n=1 Tax=Rhizopogon vinicolor AM-OR11-026 TaxID=1314800 RepID=A0A1B7N0B2_9AGAM|nr:hypothetical protein K503DRAFT_171544 [Rhizopogon vinicolor AM-OR11-026]
MFTLNSESSTLRSGAVTSSARFRVHSMWCIFFVNAAAIMIMKRSVAGVGRRRWIYCTATSIDTARAEPNVNEHLLLMQRLTVATMVQQSRRSTGFGVPFR